jgi:DNA invertase Pin-like site-specific DNA recombinase
MKPAPALRAVVYLRVSTADQHPENQEPEVCALAERRGLVIVERIEEKLSTRAARPGWARVMEMARTGKCNAVVVWAIDRLGRSLYDNLTTILELDRYRVQLLSVRDGWLDQAGPFRSVLIAIVSGLAEYERTQRSERTKAGLDRLRRKGVKLGRPQRGVNVVAARSMKVANGWPWPRVAKELGVSPATLFRALARQPGEERGAA